MFKYCAILTILLTMAGCSMVRQPDEIELQFGRQTFFNELGDTNWSVKGKWILKDNER